MVATKLKALDPTVVTGDSLAKLAQLYLASAYDSVSNLIEETYPALRGLRSADRGRLTHAEHDLFRAAIVFTGAGLDAVLKEAVRACLETRVSQSEGARAKYVAFVAKRIQERGELSPERLAQLLTSPDPEGDLRAAYVDSLTSSSMQSRAQVQTALTALGHDARKHLYKDAASLDALFRARNEISHEMDMTDAARRLKTRRTRHERSVSTSISLCHTGLNYAQGVLNALHEELSAT